MKPVQHLHIIKLLKDVFKIGIDIEPVLLLMARRTSTEEPSAQ